MSTWKVEYEIDGEWSKVSLQESEGVFSNYRRAVVRAARANLKRLGKNASGRLSRSLNVKVVRQDYLIEWSPNGLPYWQFVDYGVKGAKYALRAPDSPFQFGTGTGPKGKLIPAIDKWVVVKPIPDARDQQGRFIPRKELVRNIARSVYLNGLETTNFFTDPMVNLWERYQLAFEDAMYQDLEKALEGKIPAELIMYLP
jgi:hypothetical protein